MLWEIGTRFGSKLADKAEKFRLIGFKNLKTFSIVIPVPFKYKLNNKED